MANLAIITARSGSKRIPKKNIKEFCGKPIIAYSIEAAIESGYFDEIMVSTDSEEIARVARLYGAKVPFFRSEKNSDDFATTSDVLIEVISNYLEIGRNFKYGCCIYPTAPFLTGKKIKEGMELLHETGVDTVIPLVAFSYPPQRGFIKNEDRFVFMHPELSTVRSQDLDTIYHDCGQFYCFDIARFIEDGDLLSGKISGIIVTEMETQDIDTINDWELAELKYKYNHTLL